MFVATVLIAVFEHAYSSGRRTGRVVDHFGHVHPRVGIPADGHRAVDLGFGRHQVYGQPLIGQLKGGQLLVGRQRRFTYLRIFGDRVTARQQHGTNNNENPGTQQAPHDSYFPANSSSIFTTSSAMRSPVPGSA